MDGSPRPERGQVTRVLRLRPASRLGWLPDCLAFFAILVVARVARSDTTLSYSESASPGVTRLFQHDGLTWDALTPAPTIAGTIAWSVLRAGSGGDQRAVVSLTSSRQLVRQAWDGTSWGAAFTVTSDTGHYASRVFAAEHERSSGDHIVVYRRGANTSVYYRVFGSGSSAEQTFAMGLNSAPRWIELTPKPASDEMILLVATDTRLYGAVWDGSSFGNLQTLATSLPTTGRPFAAAYSSASGQAMVAWGVNYRGSPQYRRWTGTAWDVTTSLSAGSMVSPCGKSAFDQQRHSRRDGRYLSRLARVAVEWDIVVGVDGAGDQRQRCCGASIRLGVSARWRIRHDRLARGGHHIASISQVQQRRTGFGLAVDGEPGQ